MKSKKSKYRWSLWIIGILFFVGVLAILYPLISNLISTMTANTVIENYQNDVKKYPQEDIEDMFKQADNFNKNLFNGIVSKEKSKCLNQTDGIMCYLDIPTIDVYLPVYYGTSKEVLEKGCGYIENTSLPVGGNNTHSVISGHTGLPSAEMLTNLDKTKKGDVFYIHILGKILAYQIDDIHSVLPNETDSLNIIPNKDYITLLTCTPYGVNDHRLLVRGKRIPYDYSEDEANGEEQSFEQPTTKNKLDDNVFRQMVVIFLISLSALIIFSIAFLILYINRRKYLKDIRSNKYG